MKICETRDWGEFLESEELKNGSESHQGMINKKLASEMTARKRRRDVYRPEVLGVHYTGVLIREHSTYLGTHDGTLSYAKLTQVMYNSHHVRVHADDSFCNPSAT